MKRIKRTVSVSSKKDKDTTNDSVYGAMTASPCVHDGTRDDGLPILSAHGVRSSNKKTSKPECPDTDSEEEARENKTGDMERPDSVEDYVTPSSARKTSKKNKKHQDTDQETEAMKERANTDREDVRPNTDREDERPDSDLEDYVTPSSARKTSKKKKHQDTDQEPVHEEQPEAMKERSNTDQEDERPDSDQEDERPDSDQEDYVTPSSARKTSKKKHEDTDLEPDHEEQTEAMHERPDSDKEDVRPDTDQVDDETSTRKTSKKKYQEKDLEDKHSVQSSVDVDEEEKISKKHKHDSIGSTSNTDTSNPKQSFIICASRWDKDFPSVYDNASTPLKNKLKKYWNGVMEDYPDWKIYKNFFKLRFSPPTEKKSEGSKVKDVIVKLDADTDKWYKGTVHLPIESFNEVDVKIAWNRKEDKKFPLSSIHFIPEDMDLDNHFTSDNYICESSYWDILFKEREHKTVKMEILIGNQIN
tara:strand:+ start:120 stop:1538 length:1419 start_codon:yes stop_codon:yes gene_type:complete